MTEVSPRNFLILDLLFWVCALFWMNCCIWMRLIYKKRRYPVVPAPFIERTFPFSFTSVENQLTLCAIYLYTTHCASLIYLSFLCLDYYSFIISIEIRLFGTSNFCFFQTRIPIYYSTVVRIPGQLSQRPCPGKSSTQNQVTWQVKSKVAWWVWSPNEGGGMIGRGSFTQAQEKPGFSSSSKLFWLF